jgi:DNA-directed RNA polymerase I and III subunit RPAC2
MKLNETKQQTERKELLIIDHCFEMSVNELKLKKATVLFAARGTGPASSRTFCLGDEDHTLGNSVRHILMQNRTVGFCGYSVPHPSEPVVQIRIQTQPETKGGDAPTAIDALKVGCQTLHDQCDIVLEKLESLLPGVQEDRIRMEKILLEEGLMDEDEDEEDEDDMEVVVEE